MFNPTNFEQEVKGIVTREVSAAFKEILESKSRKGLSEGLKMQNQILSILHSITEETIAQIAYGLIVTREEI